MAKIHGMLRIMFAIAAIFSLFLLASCNDPSSPASENLSISVAAEKNLNKPSADSLRIDTVKILIRDLKIKHASSNDSLNLKVGPFVVVLNANQSIHTVSINQLPEGSYKRVEFSIHKLENSETPPDPEFRESSNNRYSVIVKGEFNGNIFVYKSEKSAKQKVDLVDSAILSGNEMTNLTLTVDPYSWFISNGTYLDPTNINNVNDIDNLIKDSFKRVFKDNNKDGKPD